MPNIELKGQVYSVISSLLEDKTKAISPDSPLMGNDSVLDSAKLVELFLVLENMATDLGFDFDWTSNVSMSKSRGVFSSAGALATEFVAQSQNKRAVK